MDNYSYWGSMCTRRYMYAHTYIYYIDWWGALCEVVSAYSIVNSVLVER